MERLFKYFDFPSLLDQNGMRYGFRFSLNIQHPAQHTHRAHIVSINPCNSIEDRDRTSGTCQFVYFCLMTANMQQLLFLLSKLK